MGRRTILSMVYISHAEAKYLAIALGNINNQNFFVKLIRIKSLVKKLAYSDTFIYIYIYIYIVHFMVCVSVFNLILLR